MAVALVALLRQRGAGAFLRLSLPRAAIVSFLVLDGILHARMFPCLEGDHYWYFCTYWALYIAGAIAVFFVIHELFKSRWSRARPQAAGFDRLPLGSLCLLRRRHRRAVTPRVPGVSTDASGMCDQLMRCESIFLLCLLLFLMVAAGKLGLSYRSRVFGVSFGFGIMAASNLITPASS